MKPRFIYSDKDVKGITVIRKSEQSPTPPPKPDTNRKPEPR